MARLLYFLSRLCFVILYFFILLSKIALSQSFDVPENFIESPLIYSYETNLKGISKITPLEGLFSKYSSLELSQVRNQIRDPSNWLRDKIYDVLGDIAETERLLRSQDSPFADPIFEQFKHLPIFIDDTIEQLALNPLVFCKNISVMYNKSGKFYELNCTVPFGFFNNYLLLRLQLEKKNWYFTKITTLNYNRMIEFLTIADSFHLQNNN